MIVEMFLCGFFIGTKVFLWLGIWKYWKRLRLRFLVKFVDFVGEILNTKKKISYKLNRKPIKLLEVLSLFFYVYESSGQILQFLLNSCLLRFRWSLEGLILANQEFGQLDFWDSKDWKKEKLEENYCERTLKLRTGGLRMEGLIFMRQLSD